MKTVIQVVVYITAVAVIPAVGAIMIAEYLDLHFHECCCVKGDE